MGTISLKRLTARARAHQAGEPSRSAQPSVAHSEARPAQVKREAAAKTPA